jgi:uncharacterized protein YecT (DUF1311 family)
MKKRFASVILVLTCLSYPFASPTRGGSVLQDQPQHPIDKALDACIEKNGSTAGMVECTDQAYAAWDTELNKIYGQLMRTLSAKQKEALKLSELEWIKYRDLEFKFIDSIYDTMQGTMYIPMRVATRLEVIKKRALELQSHLDLIEDSE